VAFKVRNYFRLGNDFINRKFTFRNQLKMPFKAYRLILLILGFSLALISCQKPCSDEGKEEYGNQNFKIEYYYQDSTGSYNLLLPDPNPIGLNYNPGLVRVFLDSLGFSGTYTEPYQTPCVPLSGYCGPFIWGTGRVVGKVYKYTYLLQESNTNLNDYFRVEFLMQADKCKTFFSYINYYYNDQLLPEYKDSQDATVRILR
jgi:hypothetical protein